MDEALVEHPENDVDDDQRRQDEQRNGSERLLEGLRRALERTLDRGRQVEVRLSLADGGSRLAESGTRRQIEADRHGRELALVADRQRLSGVRGPVR